MGKHFGTDGIRGVYGKSLDIKIAFKAGLALAGYFGAGEYVVVRDTRESGPWIEDAVIKGIYAGGGSVLAGGVLPTPSAAFLVKKYGARAGIVISASHNPPEYNGIKVFDSEGLKIDQEAEEKIEQLMESAEEPKPDAMGTYKVLSAAKQDYIKYLTGAVDTSLDGLEVFLDCCFGATAQLAKEVFEALGAKVRAFNDIPDGKRINCNCGAVHPEVLAGKMGDSKGLGFSFDGDGDRLAVVRDGAVLDGDTLLYNLACSMELQGNAVVGTVLANLALEEGLLGKGIKFFRTPVGDKHIAKMLYQKGFSLGGEKSGHFIINKACLTGDAILTALYFSAHIFEGGKLKEHQRLSLYPQVELNYPADKSIMEEGGFLELIEKSKLSLGAEGRVIARMSGTEPKVRVMVEGRNAARVQQIVEDFQQFFGAI